MKPLPSRLPHTAAGLVALLDKCVPHRCPKRGEDAEEVQRYAGKRELVDILLAKLKESDTDDMEGIQEE